MNVYLERMILLSASCFLLSAQHGSAQGFGFEVPVTSPWFDTGLDILAGSQLIISASGVVRYGGSPEQIANADGVGEQFDGTSTDPRAVFPNTIVVSLIGKIGGTTAINTGIPVPEGVSGRGPGFVGTSYSQIIPETGRLFLGYNDLPDFFGDNSGSFTVTGYVVPVPEPTLSLLAATGFVILLLRSITHRRR